MANVRVIKIDGVTYRTFHLLDNDINNGKGELSKQSCELSKELIMPLEIAGLVQGYKNQNLKQLEHDTQTRIVIYKNSSSTCHLQIRGHSKELFELAQKALENIIKNSSTRKLTHFLSLLLNFKSSNIDLFYQNAPSLIGLEASKLKLILKPKTKLHLTLSVHTLASSNELEEIDSIIKRNVLAMGGKLQIHFKGLKVFKGEPENCKVLVCLPADPSSLNLASQSLLKDLVKAGYSSNLSVTWHCTLLNVRDTFIKAFDASKLLSQYSDYDFGNVIINELCLLKFHNEKSSTNVEHYEMEKSYKL